MAELKNFYVRDFEAWKKTLSRKKLSDKELEVKVVERGIVLPTRPIPGKTFVYEGGVCDNNFKFVTGFSRIENTLGGGDSLPLNHHILLTGKNSSALTRMLFSVAY